MKSVDRHVLVLLDDIAAVTADIKRLFPEAVASAESVSVGGQRSGVAVRSSRLADPTPDAALDPRRQRRASNVKHARRAVKRANSSLREALAHVTLAAER